MRHEHRQNYKQLKFFDYTLFSAILTLTIFSLITLYSATSINAPQYFIKQFVWVLISFFIMLFIIFIDIESIRDYIPFIMLSTIALLVIVLITPKIQNVHRWIPLKFMNFQPSEFAKIAVILYIANYCDLNFSKLNEIKFLIKPAITIGIILILIAMEPDLGTPFLIFAVSSLLFFLTGVKLKYLIIPIISSIPLITVEIIRHPYRLTRLKTFLAPWENMKKETYQLAQSLIAIGSGGWLGVGAGASKIKLKYLPESHTDFIFPIIAEEFGFMGSFFIIFLFLVIIYRGFLIAKTAKNHFLSLLAAGSTLFIFIQALFNIAMVSGLIPTKGLPLPFFSYGGTSIMTTMIFCGFILSVSIRRSNI